MDLLTQHKEKNHYAAFGCNYCTNRFSSLDDLNIHVKKVHSFICDLCPAGPSAPAFYMNMAFLTEHKEKYHPAIFGCNHCVNRFSSLDDLNNHVKSVHSFECNSCPALFVELSLLKDHKEKYHPAIFGCNYCVNRFASLNDLNNHITSIHRFECDLCPAFFVEMAYLTQHKEQFHPAINYCNYCDHSFVKLRDMNLHLSSSHNFECDCCLSSFVDLSNLTKHKKHCPKPIRSLCSVCYGTFPSFQLKNHQNKIHPNSFRCTLCFFNCHGKAKMNHHVSSVHEFKCEKCKTWFYIPQPGHCMIYSNNVRKPSSLGNAPLLCNKKTCFLSCK
jgi:hypothetical protein